MIPSTSLVLSIWPTKRNPFYRGVTTPFWLSVLTPQECSTRSGKSREYRRTIFFTKKEKKNLSSYFKLHHRQSMSGCKLHHRQSMSRCKNGEPKTSFGQSLFYKSVYICKNLFINNCFYYQFFRKDIRTTSG